jgi:hypothetical protein
MGRIRRNEETRREVLGFVFLGLLRRMNSYLEQIMIRKGIERQR